MLEFCTEDGRVTAVTCSKVKNDLEIAKWVMGRQQFLGFALYCSKAQFFLQLPRKYFLHICEFDVQCMKIWYKFVNNNVPTYFASMFRYNRELYDIQTRSHELLHLYPVRTSNARNALRHPFPELLCKYPTAVPEKARTHSIMSFTSHVKFHLLDFYGSDCLIPQCYICTRLT